MTYEECMEQVARDSALVAERQQESARMQAAMDAFNTEFQARWAIYCAELHTLIVRGMFDPTFCAPQSTSGDVE